MKIGKLDSALHGFESLLAKAVSEWNPEPHDTERKYRDALAKLLKETIDDAVVETEYRAKGTTVDIHVKKAGLVSSSEVFFEMKRNLKTKTEYDRLVGQIEQLEPGKCYIFVVLCGETSEMFANRLREKYKKYTFDDLFRTMWIIVQHVGQSAAV